ncbi:MAG: ATP-binding protein [Cellulosilyticaceae bacterium]
MDYDEKKQGKLKIFFGYAAGVGKTYSMLEAAHVAKQNGIDVVAGYIEPHSRPDTSALIDGLEVLPKLQLSHRGLTLHEFDVDAAIKRHPALILVDELAHTNIPGSRNTKRYQDIEELLKAGINVYTTINVQHIESLNDVVYQITKVQVTERIPDKILDLADQIELVDLEPDELIERLHSGKVYKDAHAKRALEHFFTKENLIALREISLRRIADQVNKKAEQLYSSHGYYTNEHILVCISSSPSNSKVIRTAARMCNAFHGTLTALYVETPDTNYLSEENKKRLQTHLKLAEQLGARLVTVCGENIPLQIAEYAKIADVSKIVLGRSANKRYLFFTRKFVDKLTELAPHLDIYIIPDTQKSYAPKKPIVKSDFFALSWADTFKSLGILGVTTLIAACFQLLHFHESNIITIYILAVLFIAACTRGSVYSVVSSFLSVLIFTFYFTPPSFSLNTYDSSYPITFTVMFASAILTSSLTKRIKCQAIQSALTAKSTGVLLETSQKLQKVTTFDALYDVMGRQTRELLGRSVLIYPLKDDQLLDTPLTFFTASDVQVSAYLSASEKAVAEWVCKNNKNAGAMTQTLGHSTCLYMAIRSQSAVYAVIAVAINATPLNAYERNLLIAMLGEFGLSLEKEAMLESQKAIYLKAEQEQLRSNLLRAISHDLRTPLTTISGNANLLLSSSTSLSPSKKLELYNAIYDDSMWLIDLVENLLSVTRLDTDSVPLTLCPELLEEVIYEALEHIDRRHCEYAITVALDNEFLMAMIDTRLIIQVIINIVNNAIKYTAPGTHIHIHAFQKDSDWIVIEISDDGDGISDTDKAHIFDMFFTSAKNMGDSRRGLGLGLSLCKSIILSHGGDLWVSDFLPKGTLFTFTLPAKEIQPHD